MERLTAPAALFAPLLLACVCSAPASAKSASPLKQYTARGHVLAFDSTGYYVSNGTYALRVSFENADAVAFATDDEAVAHEPAPFRRLSYARVWDGIGVTYEAPASGIARSTWRLEPGADPATIRLRYNRTVTLTGSGEVAIAFDAGAMTESRPVAWQDVDGQRRPVDVEFVQLEQDVLGFRLGAYRVDLPLTIDPTLTWNTFLGGSAVDWAYAIAADGGGNVYVTGLSGESWGSPVRAFTVSGFSGDAFVAKLTSTGTLVWNTFLGGSGSDEARAIAVDGGGDVYVGGSSDAIWGSPVRAHTASSDAFVAKLTSAGALDWNTFLGGGGNDYTHAVATDGSGNVYAGGLSSATWGSPVASYTGSDDAFAAKLTPAGALVWNTFAGSGGPDVAYAIAVDSGDNVYLGGSSGNTWGSPVRTFSSSIDAFVAKLTPAGALTWNTFLGGNGADWALGIAVDGDGNVYVDGPSQETWGSPLRPYTAPDEDAFVAQLTTTGVLAWNTFLGGSGDDRATAIAIDGDGNVYVGGYSSDSWGNPVRAYTSSYDAFAARLTSSGAITWNAFVGGSSSELGHAIAADGNGAVFLGGYGIASWGSPVRAYTAAGDAFVVQIDDTQPIATPTSTATPSPTPTVGAGCAATPLAGCHPPGPQKSLLLLTNHAADDSRDKLIWKWRNSGGAVTFDDLADPTSTTSYRLCLYAGPAVAAVAIPAGSSWDVLGSIGYRFRDLLGSPNGAQKAKLRSGFGSNAKALVKGKGMNLPDALVPPLPLPVVVQMVNTTNNVCFSAFYDAAGLIKNDERQFKGKATMPLALP